MDRTITANPFRPELSMLSYVIIDNGLDEMWGRPSACGGLSARPFCAAGSPAQPRRLPHKSKCQLLYGAAH
jgi:hypothetical protein